MSSTQYVYSKQQFISDVSFNSALTVAGATTVSGAATFTSANTIINGNVGVGTTSPASKLHINGSSVASGTNISRIIQGDGSYTFATDGFQDPFTINSATVTADCSNLSIGMGVDTTSKIGYINVAQSGAVRPLYLNCRANAPVVALGNVGIGTTNPRDKLHVNGNIYSKDLLLQGDGTNGYIYTTNGGSALYLGSSNTSRISIESNGNLSLLNSSFNNPKYIVSNVGADDSAYILQAGYSGGTYSSIGIYSDWNGTGGNVGKIQFNTRGSQRMVINHDGYVGIGTANPLSLLCLNKIYSTTDYRSDKSNKISFLSNIYTYGSAIGPVPSANTPTIGHSITFLPQTYDDVGSGHAGFHGKLLFDFENATDPAGRIPLTLTSNGRIGIGTTAPGYPLHIRNGANKYVQFGAHYYISSIGNYSVGTQYDWNTGFINIYTGLYVQDGGIYTDWGINALNLYAFSDKRIKTNIVDIDDNNALSILRQIQPKTYDYVDKLKRGNANVIGFIAQEVKAILPNAVSITKDYIPNFMTVCQVSATDVSNIVLVNSPIDLSWNPLHDQSGNAFVDADGNACSDADGNKVFNVKLYDQSNNENTCKTTSILDKRSFLMDVTGSKMVDASGNLVLEADGGYFLHGQEVDDFHNLDKHAIFTVVTAAVQDMDRQVQAQAVKQQADEAQIQAQEVKIAELESKNATLETLVATQSQQIAQQQAQINAILAKIGGV